MRDLRRKIYKKIYKFSTPLSLFLSFPFFVLFNCSQFNLLLFFFERFFCGKSITFIENESKDICAGFVVHHLYFPYIFQSFCVIIIISIRRHKCPSNNPSKRHGFFFLFLFFPNFPDGMCVIIFLFSYFSI